MPMMQNTIINLMMSADKMSLSWEKIFCIVITQFKFINFMLTNQIKITSLD